MLINATLLYIFGLALGAFIAWRPLHDLTPLMLGKLILAVGFLVTIACVNVFLDRRRLKQALGEIPHPAMGNTLTWAYRILLLHTLLLLPVGIWIWAKALPPGGTLRFWALSTLVAAACLYFYVDRVNRRYVKYTNSLLTKGLSHG